MKEFTDSELKQLAIDIVDGKVFTDQHISQSQKHMLGQVFMPLLLGGVDELRAHDKLGDLGLIYEYYSEAGPLSINGMPTFTSLNFLSITDTLRMSVFYKEYYALKEQFKDGA